MPVSSRIFSTFLVLVQSFRSYIKLFDPFGAYFVQGERQEPIFSFLPVILGKSLSHQIPTLRFKVCGRCPTNCFVSQLCLLFCCGGHLAHLVVAGSALPPPGGAVVGATNFS
jgi:hypothetical protein